MTTQQVWTKYHTDLQHFIISKVKEKTIADDILQDTFIKIHTKLHTLKDITKLKSWCFSIARNSILDYWKSANKTVEIANFENETEIKENIHTEKDCLRGILKNLPKKYRDPLFLSDIKGLKQQEVANQLKQSLPTTKSQIQRARKLIAEGFMDCCGFVMNNDGNLVGEIQEKEDCKICN
ncbi:sigma-70 family RNA polymerase sigma factor [Tenacibaculum aquimarinum]|uniref:sigma-70 family RNA polymerase sigma factor n=1 Tax=Tenacibaculum aquimarinum TaxID=2910675 RepID=UPI001F0B04F5|nr:sigma-70 family RNA polymerase sigma factor [Tenacibaculum aquimarinum]MCH3885942.1 sigma-70 family RNA polymerase sigma factor [Tenacibaculum aquimarinum]